ncbi:hypothetical protein C8R45DRAFT_833281 [Mycena sanguinolenta]|nr:hypothetical protein C8R45DRAFT_833281 [Mycena sanguinolenta]
MGDGEEDETRGGDGGLGPEEGPEPYDVHWQRDDRLRWTAELSCAHIAFEKGRRWGVEWAVCVSKFFDFEAVWGYVDDGAQVRRDTRPRQVNSWLTMGRQWTLPPTISEGGSLGARGDSESWAGAWWKWWESLQPKERAIANGELSRPELVDWSKMVGLHGKNGLLLAMGTLEWWGEMAQKDVEVRGRWLTAVSDMTWVLEKMLASGDIAW